jgi:integrase
VHYRLADGSNAVHTLVAAFNHVERLLAPDKLCRMTTDRISRFVSDLRKPQKVTRNGKMVILPPMKESTIACHLRHLKAALNRGLKMGLMNQVPTFDMPEAGEAKGRPLAAEEFERMLQAVSKVRPHDPGVWTRYMYGLWLSGLRLEESLILSWDEDAAFAVDLSGQFPAFKIKAKAQKARRPEKVPLTPDFAHWLLQTLEEDRHGTVFKLPGLLDGNSLTTGRVGRIVSKIGKKAGVVVNREVRPVSEPIIDPKTRLLTGQTKLVDKEVVKYASAHDLRRSFGTRWAKELKPAVLQKLMRHANIGTTTRYYIDLDSDEVAADLWRGFSGQEGTILGTTPTEEPRKPEKAPGN